MGGKERERERGREREREREGERGEGRVWREEGVRERECTRAYFGVLFSLSIGWTDNL